MANTCDDGELQKKCKNRTQEIASKKKQLYTEPRNQSNKHFGRKSEEKPVDYGPNE